jgi:RNA polymerase sigma-70 factor, ECF subfamily
VHAGVASRAADAAEPGDAELLAASARGDQRAFANLVSRHHASVYRLAWRMIGGRADAEDVAQEAFIKLWSNPAQVREPGALKGWLMRVASNAAIDRLRRKPHDELDAAGELADQRKLADRQSEEAEARARVDRAVASLPERQRLALTLVYFESLTNIAAADVMEISVDAIESLLARAKRSLRESLAADWRLLLEELNAEG